MQTVASTPIIVNSSVSWIAGKPSEAAIPLKASTLFAERHVHVGEVETEAILPSDDGLLTVQNAIVQQSVAYSSTEGGYLVGYTVDLIMPKVFAPITPVEYAHFTGYIKVTGLPSFDDLVVDVSRCLSNGWVRTYGQQFSGTILSCFIEAGGKVLNDCFNVAMKVTFSSGLSDSGRVKYEYKGNLAGITRGKGLNVGFDTPPSSDQEFEIVCLSACNSFAES